MLTIRRLVDIFLVGALLAVSGPVYSVGETADLVRELNTQLQRAEQQRLADPWFIKDLRAIIRKYDDPWTRDILSSDFSERGSQPPTPWQVTTGEFLVDWRHGLRSVVESKAPAEPASSSEQQPDVASALLGALIQGALDNGSSDQAETAKATSHSEAKVIAPVSFDGAFSVDLKVSSRVADGSGQSELLAGPYQGKAAVAGYRLVYRAPAASDKGTLELVRQTVNGGQAIVERAATAVKLGDGAVHELLWTRDRDGRMAVSIDSKPVIEVTDRGYSGKFDGFAIRNGGGDFAVREFSLKSTE